MVAEAYKKPFDLVLEKNHKDNQTYAHEFVEHSADQLHFQNLRCYNPDNEECEDAKNILMVPESFIIL